MIIGDRSMFAIESSITQAYSRLSARALGYFVVYVSSKRYGVRSNNATLLASSFDEVEDRIAHRGIHTAPFVFEDAGKIADAFRNAFYSEVPKELFFGLPLVEFRELANTNRLSWAPDGDEAFDDGSHILQFDCKDRVRLVAFRPDERNQHDPRTLADAWLSADKYYNVLQDWRDAFEAEWVASSKDLASH